MRHFPKNHPLYDGPICIPDLLLQITNDTPRHMTDEWIVYLLRGAPPSYAGALVTTFADRTKKTQASLWHSAEGLERQWLSLSRAPTA